jgi:hypothetical protein
VGLTAEGWDALERLYASRGVTQSAYDRAWALSRAFATQKLKIPVLSNIHKMENALPVCKHWLVTNGSTCPKRRDRMLFLLGLSCRLPHLSFFLFFCFVL